MHIAQSKTVAYLCLFNFCAFELGAKALVVGNGLDEKSRQGPLINEKAVLKVERHVKESVKQGARVICGGNRLDEMGGTFFEPTVLMDVTNQMPVSCEETFGPVAPLLRYGKSKL